MSASPLLFVLSLVLAPDAALPPKPDAAAVKELVQKVQRFYDATKDLHAKFEQQIESSIGGSPKKASGDVWLKKGGKMRWDYLKPEKKLMVADGTTLWVHEPEDQQAFKQDMRGAAMPLSLQVLTGEGKIATEFDVSAADQAGLTIGAGETALLLAPKQPTTAYHHLLFVVDSATGQVKQTIIVDQQGGKNRMSFSSIETNINVPDSRFKFSPPAGTKVIQPK